MLQENLRIFRMQKGLSQEELAKRIHVVRQTVSKWETGLSVPDAQTLTQIAQVLDTSVAKLLDENPAANGEKEEDTISQIAEKLERLNREMAEKNAARCKRSRAAAITAMVLAGAVLAFLLFYAMLPLFREPSGPGIIGGADAPTGIFVYSAVNWPGVFIGGILCAVVILAGGIFLRRTK